MPIIAGILIFRSNSIYCYSVIFKVFDNANDFAHPVSTWFLRDEGCDMGFIVGP